MSVSIKPRKTDLGWVIEIPVEMAQAIGVAEGSIAVLHVKDGQLNTEILPPPSPELKTAAQRIHAKHKKAFEEMKRLGD
ncbi:MAG: hypothetical protein ETSY1_36305 [Candidatus Entotheonella factor]|uniref:Uncharacterized protein n=1 Tax=Entotheonella factor TaxID=1429438 RepID=W4L9T5_ENTF1|nr:MAG: hypothetical protein ETSY1_36305 [Candidatus Entotheonella factor]